MSQSASSLYTTLAMVTQRAPIDILITGARILDVFQGTFFEAPVAIGNGRFLGFFEAPAHKTIEASGRYLLPGLIDAHVHIESSLVSPAQFARMILPRGTTTVMADPHEIANVLGLQGIRYMLDTTEDMPLDVRIALPSCVPATPFEHSGATLGAQELAHYMGHPRVIGLGEVMNCPGVLAGDADLLAKIALTLEHGKRIEGHSPGLTGQNLQAYAAARITSDHECTSIEEMHERIRLGMYVLLREGSAAHDMRILAGGITAENASRCMFCTDDRQPIDILRDGHIDNHLRMAVQAGVPAATAASIATYSAASYFGLRDKGAIAPGYVADFILVNDVINFAVEDVFCKGVHVAHQGSLLVDIPEYDTATSTSSKPYSVQSSVHIAPLHDNSLVLPVASGKANVIGMRPHSILTDALMEEVPTDANGNVVVQGSAYSKLAVIERHHGLQSIGVGLIKGYGIQHGAIATTVAHDSHNIVVVGDNDRDMLAAIQDIATMGGGITLCRDGQCVAHLPLPIAGLMSNQPAEEVQKIFAHMAEQAHESFAVQRDVDPFMSLSFVTLPVIPELKLTDCGLFDVRSFSFIPVAIPSDND